MKSLLITPALIAVILQSFSAHAGEPHSRRRPWRASARVPRTLPGKGDVDPHTIRGFHLISGKSPSLLIWLPAGDFMMERVYSRVGGVRLDYESVRSLDRSPEFQDSVQARAAQSAIPIKIEDGEKLKDILSDTLSGYLRAQELLGSAVSTVSVESSGEIKVELLSTDVAADVEQVLAQVGLTPVSTSPGSFSGNYSKVLNGAYRTERAKLGGY